MNIKIVIFLIFHQSLLILASTDVTIWKAAAEIPGKTTESLVVENTKQWD